MKSLDNLKTNVGTLLTLVQMKNCHVKRWLLFFVFLSHVRIFSGDMHIYANYFYADFFFIALKVSLW